MKKLVSLVLVLAMSLLLVPGMAESKIVRMGELSWLNNDETARMQYISRLYQNLSDGHGPEEETDEVTYQVTEYDNLNSMLMGLISNQVDGILINFSVAAYLVANNEGLRIEINRPNFSPDASMAMIDAVTDIYSGTDFSFLMTQDNAELCEEFNKAIAEMKEDGTLQALYEKTMTPMMMGAEAEKTAMETIEGAPTIKVAVTGDLPPMDYALADGTPAGFNTAVLNEVSHRIGKNIQLVSIDAGGRAMALASHEVDAVFWARVNTPSTVVSGALTEEERATVEKLRAEFDAYRSASDDIPEGTIYTQPYYHDIYVTVSLLGSEQTEEE